MGRHDHGEKEGHEISGEEWCCCQGNEFEHTYFFCCLVSGMMELDQAKPEPREAEKGYLTRRSGVYPNGDPRPSMKVMQQWVAA